jgi:HK97 family phage portal protein
MAFRWANIPKAIRSLIGRNDPGGGVWVPGYTTESGISVSAEQAMRLAAVHSCVRVLSEDIAALPLNVYEKKKANGGRERADKHPLFDLVHNRPNPEMVSQSYVEALMVNLLLEGNAYSFIEYDGGGRVIGLWPLLSYGVQPFRDTQTKQLKYSIGGTNYYPTQILHIPGLGFDGLVGLTPIGYARESMGLAVAAEMYGAKFFKNGTHLGGVVSLTGELSKPAYDRMKESFAGLYKGLINSHSVPIMEGGATYTPIGVKPEEAQFLETRKYQRSEIAGIYRVPPHMIGDLERATFSNIEHQDSAYLQRSLLPWLMRFKNGFTTWLLSDTERKRYYVEHDTGNFLRGDIKSRYFAYAQGINAGFLVPNEARERENLNPLPGGDKPRPAPNASAATQANTEPKPAKEEPPPTGGKNQTEE